MGRQSLSSAAGRWSSCTGHRGGARMEEFCLGQRWKEIGKEHDMWGPLTEIYEESSVKESSGLSLILEASLFF